VTLSFERLLDGCVRTLREEVIPALQGAGVRGRAWAVVDVLQNLRNRVEEKAALLEAESASSAQALALLADALAAAGDAAAAEAARRSGLEAPAAPPAARAAALRAALGAAIEALYALPSGAELPPAARAALAAHLGPQAVRDVLPLTRSMLAEISKG
jgi:hypothetical protein